MKSIWELPLIVSFARCRSINRFPLSLTPLLLRQIKHYSICKSPQKNRQHCRPNRAQKKRSEINFQRIDSKKLFDSGELRRGKSKIKIPQNYRGLPSFTLVSSLVDEDKRFNAGCCPWEKSLKELSILMSTKRRLECLPATKNHQGLGDSEDESDAKIIIFCPWLWNWPTIISTYPAQTDAKAATARECW